jgi:predicted nucleic acid-binding protein
LIDTGTFYALVDVHDEHHAVAAAIFEELAQSAPRLHTTNLVVAETHALILARLRRMDLALSYINNIYSSEHTTIVHVTPSDQQRALTLLNQYSDKPFSFTDATSFVVIERLRIAHAFTFDRNFRQYGLQTLPALG